MSHILINIGMNLGLLPVTGIPLPFMSYGGSHLVTEFAGLGILMSMRRYARIAHKDDMKNEFLGA
jgi:rod shape determining protein RodA